VPTLLSRPWRSCFTHMHSHSHPCNMPLPCRESGSHTVESATDVLPIMDSPAVKLSPSVDNGVVRKHLLSEPLTHNASRVIDFDSCSWLPKKCFTSSCISNNFDNTCMNDSCVTSFRQSSTRGGRLCGWKRHARALRATKFCQMPAMNACLALLESTKNHQCHHAKWCRREHTAN
jgi:hypothetical protein